MKIWIEVASGNYSWTNKIINEKIQPRKAPVLGANVDSKCQMNGSISQMETKKMSKYAILEGVWFSLMMIGLLYLMSFL